MSTLTQIATASADDALKARVALAARVLGRFESEAHEFMPRIVSAPITDDAGTPTEIAITYDYHRGQVFQALGRAAEEGQVATPSKVIDALSVVGADQSLITDGTILRAVRKVLTEAGLLQPDE